MPAGSRASTKPSFGVPSLRIVGPATGSVFAWPEKLPTAYTFPARSTARLLTWSPLGPPKRRAQSNPPLGEYFATKPSSPPTLLSTWVPGPGSKSVDPEKPPPTYRLPLPSRASAVTVSLLIPPNWATQTSAPAGEYFARKPSAPPRLLSTLRPLPGSKFADPVKVPAI